MTTFEEKRDSVISILIAIVNCSDPIKKEYLEKLEAYQQKEDIAPILLDLLMDNEMGYAHRRVAAMVLAGWQKTEAIPMLEKLLETSIYDLQDTALAALFQYDDPRAVKVIINTLYNTNPEIARLAKEYLKAHPSEEAREALNL